MPKKKEISLREYQKMKANTYAPRVIKPATSSTKKSGKKAR